MPSDTPSNITIGSTNISLSKIKNAFVGTTYKLSDYYKGGTNVYNVLRLYNIPTSGKISFKNFANTTNVIQTSIPITSTNNNPNGPYTTNTTYEHNFNIPNDIIKFISIDDISFKFSVSTGVASRTTVLNMMSKFIIYLNNNTVSANQRYNYNDNTNYIFRFVTITSTHNLLIYNNKLYVTTSSGIIYTYTNATFEINITYIR